MFMTDMDTHNAPVQQAEHPERIRNIQRLVDEARACGDSIWTSAEMRQSVRQRIAPPSGVKLPKG